MSSPALPEGQNGENEMSGSKFIHCPNCGDTDFEDADFEDANGDSTGEITCNGCGLTFMPDELVCEDEDN